MLAVSVKTLSNWEAGRSRVPYAAFKLLKVMTSYELPGEAWERWSLRGDTLWSPDGRSFKAWELMQLEHVFSEARLWRDVLFPKSNKPTGKILPYRTKADKVQQPTRRPVLKTWKSKP